MATSRTSSSSAPVEFKNDEANTHSKELSEKIEFFRKKISFFQSCIFSPKVIAAFEKRQMFIECLPENYSKADNERILETYEFFNSLPREVWSFEMFEFMLAWDIHNTLIKDALDSLEPKFQTERNIERLINSKNAIFWFYSKGLVKNVSQEDKKSLQKNLNLMAVMFNQSESQSTSFKWLPKDMRSQNNFEKIYANNVHHVKRALKACAILMKFHKDLRKQCYFDGIYELCTKDRDLLDEISDFPLTIRGGAAINEMLESVHLFSKKEELEELLGVQPPAVEKPSESKSPSPVTDFFDPKKNTSTSQTQSPSPSQTVEASSSLGCENK